MTGNQTAGNGGIDQYGDEVVAGLLDALNNGMSAEDYLELRALGGDHNDIIELTSQRCATWTIKRGLKSGATCAELNEVGAPWARLNLYCEVRRNGQNHAAGLEALALGINVIDYANCIHGGVTHAEIVEIAALTKSLFDYGKCRAAGIPHSELLVASKLGISPIVVRQASQRGIGIAKLVAAAERGENLSVYTILEAST